MNKRAFLEGFLSASTVAFGGLFMWERINNQPLILAQPSGLPNKPKSDALNKDISQSFRFTKIELEASQPSAGLPSPAPSITASKSLEITELDDMEVAKYLRKIRNFDAIFASDIYLDPRYETLLLKTAQHLTRVENYIGHGNFNLMSLDEMIKAGRAFPKIGLFEADELNFLEEIFFANPHRYGFFGKKISRDITDFIPKNDVAKISNSGHFLLKGESLNLYDQIRRDVGDQVILTSGVRGNVKQMHLFLAKAIEAQGNLSRASRSLAPPGHSYHGIGDFDIGKIGLGQRNFTSDFSSTEEYKRIARLGYVDIRYPTDNLFGVRFEPWHIKLG
ncbi:MAG: M15 family metallopeptidase [Pseudohongiellaceae bacterium]